ncbi:MAG: radical SAM protein [Chloroflexi bacterium]|nr:radical SAM protein [Chloroflexota bacterium]
MRALLLSTYELGHPPFGLASPAAWLAEAGATVACNDLAVEPLNAGAVAAADLVALYVPMHTATRLAAEVLPKIIALNPRAHVCCYGLYAPMNEPYLRRLGAHTLLGGEFETALVALYQRLAANLPPDPPPAVSLPRQTFRVPKREALPPLSAYAQLVLPDGSSRLAGYTEASRGCKHLCRHCPIVPVYGGQFRIIQRPTVLADVAWQVEAGAQHITFGDPDFFNGPGHAIPLVQELHHRHPALTYDVTIKIEHLLKHADLLPILRDTGCLFVTSAVEAVDDAILEKLDKRHTTADFIRAATSLRQMGLALNPTFLPFTPWTTLANYTRLLQLIANLGLIENVAPVQYAIRLLIPAGSLLLALPDVAALVSPFDEAALSYPWAHPGPRLDQLQADIFALVQTGIADRAALFEQVWRLTQEAADDSTTALPFFSPRTPIPHLSEPWYC